MPTRCSPLRLLLLGSTLASPALQADLLEDSSLELKLRHGYMSRDWREDRDDQSRWGQSAQLQFSSGYTEGALQFGIDAFAQGAVNLDDGPSRTEGGINFFYADPADPFDDPAKNVGEVGAALKIKWRNTELKIGDQSPYLPVLSHDMTRLLPQTFNGWLLTDTSVKNLTIHAGHFTQQNNANRSGRDNARLDAIDVLGAKYQFHPEWSASLYGADVHGIHQKIYLNLSFSRSFADDKELSAEINAYHTRFDNDPNNPAALAWRGDGIDDDNQFMSAQVSWRSGPHTWLLAHQRVAGDTGYPYNFGDGGTAMWIPNSYFSDFNDKDERSWQLSYQYDFSEIGIKGLRFKTAYVDGRNIDVGGAKRARENEWLNMFTYEPEQVKNLKFTLRSSRYRASQNYGSDMDEIRFFVDYKTNLF